MLREGFVLPDRATFLSRTLGQSFGGRPVAAGLFGWPGPEVGSPFVATPEVAQGVSRGLGGAATPPVVGAVLECSQVRGCGLAPVSQGPDLAGIARDRGPRVRPVP